MSIGIWKSSNRVLAAAMALPVMLGIFSLLIALNIPPIAGWFWPAVTTNAAEAAALGDAARVRALAYRGTPVDVPLPVRSEFREEGAPEAMTPLEAAIRLEGATHREGDSIVEVLLDLGVRPRPEEVRRLYCLAEQVEAPEAAGMLRETFDLSSTTCR